MKCVIATVVAGIIAGPFYSAVAFPIDAGVFTKGISGINATTKLAEIALGTLIGVLAQVIGARRTIGAIRTRCTQGGHGVSKAIVTKPIAGPST